MDRIIKKIRVPVALAAAAIFVLTACARRVMTNAYLAESAPAQPFAPGAGFAVLGNENALNPIFDQTVRRKIETVLSRMNYRIVPAEQADYVIRYGYGVEGETRIDTDPVYFAPPYDHSFYFYGSPHEYPAWRSGYFMNYYSTDVYNVYYLSLLIKVLQNVPEGKTGKLETVWVGETSTESSNYWDLREMVDYLLVANFEYFGADTRKPKEVKIPKDNTLLRLLRVQPPPGKVPVTPERSAIPAPPAPAPNVPPV